MNTAPHVRPVNCPVCNSKMEPRILFMCRSCFMLVPGGERVHFARLYEKFHRSEASWLPKLQKLIRLAKEKFSSVPSNH